MQKIDWNEVYRKQSGVLIGVAYRYVRERKQAEDLVQDALIAAIQKADKFSGKGAFEAWLRKIVVNECLMYLRKAKIKTENLDDMPHVGANHDSPTFAENEEEEFNYEDDFDKRKVIERCNFSKEDLLEIATHLPEHHRLVFNMYVIDNFSHKEIAAQLNISEGTSKSHLNRARKKLQDLLYQKALDMQNKKKKRLLVAAWFGAMFGKVSVVDAMHRKAFADFTLLAPPPSMGLEQAILSAPTASVGLSATATSIVAATIAACGVGGTIGLVEYQKHRTELQETTIEYQIPDASTSSASFYSEAEPAEATDVADPNYKSEPAKKIIEEEIEIIEEELPPLIIKKITVIDTIYED